VHEPDGEQRAGGRYRLAPRGVATHPDAALEHERYRSHRAVRELLERLADTQPLVLLLDARSDRRLSSSASAAATLSGSSISARLVDNPHGLVWNLLSRSLAGFAAGDVDVALGTGEEAVDAAAHVHPYQTERFEILEGLVGLRIGGDEFAAGPGDVAVVPPGTPHRFWNAFELVAIEHADRVIGEVLHGVARPCRCVARRPAGVAVVVADHVAAAVSELM
jgi:mannose-6-phosphate isomerase-like protein (cupin superfamily)